MEKETLKKYLLQFGYGIELSLWLFLLGRWAKIKKYSKFHCKILSNKSEIEMKAFANDFVRTVFEFLHPSEKNELKNFLINLLDEKTDDPFV